MSALAWQTNEANRSHFDAGSIKRLRLPRAINGSSHLSRAANLQAARGLPQGEGPAVQAGDLPQRVRTTGRASDQVNPPHFAAWWQGAHAL